MDYETMINKSDEIKDFINLSVTIFNELKDKKLKCKTLNHYSERTHELNDRDKLCISLFLSLLIVNKDVIINMEKYGINMHTVLECINLDHLEFEKLSNNNIKELYETYFESAMKEFNLINISIYRFLSIISNSVGCGSKIITFVVRKITKDSSADACFHDSFGKTIRVLESKKSDNEVKEMKDKIAYIKDGLQNLATLNSNYKEDKKNENKNLFDELTNKDYKINPAIGRDEELKKLMLALATSDKSAIITGEAGTGKTALVEGFAYRIKNKQVPTIFQNKAILKLNTSSLVAGCARVGDFEEKVEALLNDVIKHDNVILFIDEIHTTIGMGAGNNSNNDLANILKPYLDRGKIKIIAATTNEEYDKYISTDKAFKRRFERISIKELDKSNIINILKNRIPYLEAVTKVKFNLKDKDLILEFITNITNKEHRNYNDYTYNPDLSLQILEKSFAHALIENSEEVRIIDISNAIKSCDRLYEKSRMESSKKLLQLFNEKEKTNIIKFKNY